MNTVTNHFAHTAMLIRRPIAQVFQAFVDPNIITKFWFTNSSGALENGKTVTWTWAMYDLHVNVKVLALSTNETIIIQWGDDPYATVKWTFKSIDDQSTFVEIFNFGFKGECDQLIAQIRDSTGGFTWVLAGLKAYLEHGIQLNLVSDRYPPEPKK